MKRLLLVVMLLHLLKISANAQKLYAFAFADNKDLSNEETIKSDLHSFRELAHEVALDIDYDITFTSYTGERYAKRYFEEVINQISFDTNDIVLFAYFGHGLRSSEDISVFPQITFNSNDETEFIPLEDVKTIFVDKGARFVLVIGDCGNSVSENITAKKLIPNKNKTRLLKTKNNIKRTFFTVKGSVIVSASSKGEFALSDNRKGSIFAQSFFSNCTNYVRNGIWRDSNPSWSWRDILQDTKNDVAQKAKIIKSEKPCRQTTIYSIDIH